jgi:hypothetical protein
VEGRFFELQHRLSPPASDYGIYLQVNPAACNPKSPTAPFPDSFRVADQPPGMRRRGMASVSSTSPLHGACKILVDGTKIGAELNNL